MKPNYTVHYSLLLVLIAHAGVLAAVMYAPTRTPQIKIEPPTIQGVIVASEPIEKPPEALPPPPPEPKQQSKPKTPLPKAPASEKAITQDTLPDPIAPAEHHEPVEQPVTASVVPPQADASQLNNQAPAYPQLSRRLREEGVVILEILVKADGSLGEMHLKKSSGFNRLDDAAQRAVKNWHFIPAKRGSEAIDYWYELPIEFSLNH